MMTAQRHRFAVLAASAAALFGCTNTGLHRDIGPPPPPPQTTIDVQGTFCTEDPEDVAFPVKVWMVLDNTGSMNQNDPGEERFNAAIALAQALEDTDPPPDMFFGAMIFSEGGLGTQRITLPDRFTPSAATFQGNIDAVRGQANGGTPYVTALNFTFGELSQDATEDPVIARRTRYVVIFLSDGNPTGDDDNPQTIAAATENLLGLRDRVGDLTLNTVYLGGGNPEAETLLMSMAQQGNGIYKSFPAGEQLDFSDFDFSSIRRNYNQRFFLVSNLSAVPSKTGQHADSDRDGMADYLEAEIATDPSKRDTDGDGCSDLFEHRDAGWDPLIPGTENNQCVCTAAERTGDNDKDGLSDCEEKWMGTSSEYPDTDKNEDDLVIGDLVPDGMDYTYLNDVNFPNDGMDFDADGVQDLAELRTHMEPHVTDNAIRSDWAYDYVYLDQQPDNPRCYDFLVSNVSVMNTVEAEGAPAKENQIILYFAQSPQDNAQKEKSFRIARKTVSYSNLETVNVVPEDFSEILIAQPE